MIDPELLAKLNDIEAKVDKAFHAAESARKYLFWTGVITAVLFVLPLIGLLFAVPQFIDSYTTTLQGITF